MNIFSNNKGLTLKGFSNISNTYNVILPAVYTALVEVFSNKKPLYSENVEIRLDFVFNKNEDDMSVSVNVPDQIVDVCNNEVRIYNIVVNYENIMVNNFKIKSIYIEVHETEGFAFAYLKG